jgi:hypothetical protein
MVVLADITEKEELKRPQKEPIKDPIFSLITIL